MKKPNPWQRKAMIRNMAERKKVKRQAAFPVPGDWESLTEAQKDAHRKAEAQREADMDLDWNPLTAG